jgi:hypothetical protein
MALCPWKASEGTIYIFTAQNEVSCFFLVD